MKKTAIFLSVAGVIMTSAPSAHAHSYYNLTGAGQVGTTGAGIGLGLTNSINGTDGVSANSNGTNRVANGVNTTFDATTNNMIPGTGTMAGTANEVGGNLPYMWYSGQHTYWDGYTKREMYTGTSSTDNVGKLAQTLPTLPNGVNVGGTQTDWGTTASPNATFNPGGLWRAYTVQNGSATWGPNLPDPSTSTDAAGTAMDRPYLAVAGNSWETGQGLDYGLIHISCGANSAGDNCANDQDPNNAHPGTGTGDVKATITIVNDSNYSSFNGLLNVALYRGADSSLTSDRDMTNSEGANIGGSDPQGSNLGTPIWTASMDSVDDILYYEFIFNQAEWAATDTNSANPSSPLHTNGFYTLIIGAHGGASSDGYVYDVLVTTSPVPLPAAVWLFGSALAGFGVFGRRKLAVALTARSSKA